MNKDNIDLNDKPKDVSFSMIVGQRGFQHNLEKTVKEIPNWKFCEGPTFNGPTTGIYFYYEGSYFVFPLEELFSKLCSHSSSFYNLQTKIYRVGSDFGYVLNSITFVKIIWNYEYDVPGTAGEKTRKYEIVRFLNYVTGEILDKDELLDFVRYKFCNRVKYFTFCDGYELSEILKKNITKIIDISSTNHLYSYFNNQKNIFSTSLIEAITNQWASFNFIHLVVIKVPGKTLFLCQYDSKDIKIDLFEWVNDKWIKLFNLK